MITKGGDVMTDETIETAKAILSQAKPGLRAVGKQGYPKTDFAYQVRDKSLEVLGKFEKETEANAYASFFDLIPEFIRLTERLQKVVDAYDWLTEHSALVQYGEPARIEINGQVFSGVSFLDAYSKARIALTDYN